MTSVYVLSDGNDSPTFKIGWWSGTSDALILSHIVNLPKLKMEYFKEVVNATRIVMLTMKYFQNDRITFTYQGTECKSDWYNLDPAMAIQYIEGCIQESGGTYYPMTFEEKVAAIERCMNGDVDVKLETVMLTMDLAEMMHIIRERFDLALILGAGEALNHWNILIRTHDYSTMAKILSEVRKNNSQLVFYNALFGVLPDYTKRQILKHIEEA